MVSWVVLILPSSLSVLLEDPALKKKKVSNDKKKQHSNDKKKKDTKKKSQKKGKKKDLTLDYYKYMAACVGFGIVGKILRKSVYAQGIFTVVFYIYIYWFSCRFDRLKKEELGLN